MKEIVRRRMHNLSGLTRIELSRASKQLGVSCRGLTKVIPSNCLSDDKVVNLGIPNHTEIYSDANED